MKTKIAVMSTLIFLLAAMAGHAIVLQQGVLQAVSADVRTVTIDQQRFQVTPDSKVYMQSKPDVVIKISNQFKGYKVMFDSRYVENQNPVLVYLLVLDD